MMVFALAGEVAAVVTALLWTTCSILFARAGKRIGPLSVNSIRIVFALVFIVITHVMIFQTIIPAANNSQWFYLTLSGVIGLALGDFGYFGVLMILGPRKGVLMMSLAPVFTILFGFIILGEVLDPWTYIGIIVTLVGVFIVVIEKDEGEKERGISGKRKIYGILLGLGGAVGQGLGLVISRYGMLAGTGDDVPLHSLSITFIRMLSAALFIWMVVILFGKTGKIRSAIKDIKAMKLTLGGSFVGPFLGVWLSMVAITYAATGVASTLMSLMPVLVIPYLWILFRERTNRRGILGAVIAVVGVALLFLV